MNYNNSSSSVKFQGVEEYSNQNQTNINQITNRLLKDSTTQGVQVQKNISFGQSSEINHTQSLNNQYQGQVGVKKLVHYENPRKYIEYNNTSNLQNTYNQQSIKYTNLESCSCNHACVCTNSNISKNPSYRFVVTKEFDIMQASKQENENYETLLLKIANLESLHIQEVSSLKKVIEELTIENEKIRSMKQEQTQEKIIYKEVINTQENDQLKETIAKLEQKLVSVKEKKKSLSSQVQQISQELIQKDTKIQMLQINSKEQSENVSMNNQTNSLNFQELENQNQYLLMELGRISEEYESLKKNSNVIEKVVYLPSVQKITTVKEVPPYIEQKLVYVQDREQLDVSNKIIASLQSEILKLNSEYISLQQKLNEEKAELHERISQLTLLQTAPHVIKEVIVKKVVDRTEITQKEQELIEQDKRINEQSLKIKELEQIISNLQIEISRFTKHYKLVKMPNTYRIEQFGSYSIQQQYKIEQNHQNLSNDKIIENHQYYSQNNNMSNSNEQTLNKYVNQKFTGLQHVMTEKQVYGSTDFVEEQKGNELQNSDDQVVNQAYTSSLNTHAYFAQKQSQSRKGSDDQEHLIVYNEETIEKQVIHDSDQQNQNEKTQKFQHANYEENEDES